MFRKSVATVPAAGQLESHRRIAFSASRPDCSFRSEKPCAISASRVTVSGERAGPANTTATATTEARETVHRGRRKCPTNRDPQRAQRYSPTYDQKMKPGNKKLAL